jgi:5-methylcytosine-specific restriction endonuclease McrA
MKIDRQAVYDKYQGHCAYCGCELQKGWHVDELLPVKRKYKYVDRHWEHRETKERLWILPDNADRRKWKYVLGKYVQNGCEYPENYNIDNQMPACASCNINKHSMSLEEFRQLIQGFMKHLNGASVQYKIAKRYGLIEEHINPIEFYFEYYEKCEKRWTDPNRSLL